MFDNIVDVVKSYAPQVLLAVIVLVVGWLLALVISRLIDAALRRLRIGERLQTLVVNGEKAEALPVELWVSRAIFALLLLIVLGAFFQIVGLTVVTDPILVFLNEIFAYAPRLIGPVVLILLAWIVASFMRVVVRRSVDKLKIREESSETGTRQLSEMLSDTAYWLILLLFLPAVLSSLGLDGLLQPVQAMVGETLSYLPNLLAAGVILVVGWFVARILRRIVTNLLAVSGTDRLLARGGDEASMAGQKPSDLIGLVVYVLVFVPVLIAALNALQIQAITAPASAMLSTFLAALPAIFSAGVVLVIAYVVGRIVAGFVSTLLAGVGFNSVLAHIGLRVDIGKGWRTPAEVVGSVTFVAILTFAAIEALRLIGFQAIAELGVRFVTFATQIGVGLVILALGFWIANTVANVIRATNYAQAGFFALISRIAILTLAFAMGLGAMGLAEEIIVLAFGLTLGAVAVAFAVAFGMGGRDFAARQIATWHGSFSEQNKDGSD